MCLEFRQSRHRPHGSSSRGSLNRRFFFGPLCASCSYTPAPTRPPAIAYVPTCLLTYPRALHTYGVAASIALNQNYKSCTHLFIHTCFVSFRFVSSRRAYFSSNGQSVILGLARSCHSGWTASGASRQSQWWAVADPSDVGAVYKLQQPGLSIAVVLDFPGPHRETCCVLFLESPPPPPPPPTTTQSQPVCVFGTCACGAPMALLRLCPCRVCRRRKCRVCRVCR